MTNQHDPARGRVRWEEMFLDELEAAFQRCPVAYLTYGLCEPHGPHNAVGLDALKAHAIACQAAEAHGGIVAPPDYWHIHEIGGYANWSHDAVGTPPRHWLTAMPPWQHFKNICYHIRTVDALGFHAAILITGHYGPNWRDLKRLVDLLQPHVGTRLYTLPEFEANVRGWDGDGVRRSDHAGKVETSMLWAVRPDCVDMSRIPAQWTPSPNFGFGPFAMGKDAAQANRVTGEKMISSEVAWLGQKAQELRAAYATLQPAHTFTTFTKVEAVWHSVIAPAMKDFETLMPEWAGQPILPENSPWRANNAVPTNWR
jgi:creatinine amidohydrolase